LKDSDILHCTHARTLLIKKYKREMATLCEELRDATGLISFTCDVWSSVVLQAFLAVMLHY
ncbi:hypothetical protein C8Q80DRAFT_1066584, partial [Daedaleopsis nitida]